MEYKVIKQHLGDKQYFEGDTRIVENENDAKQLIAAGLISEETKTAKAPAKKAAPKTQNKMAPKTSNKAK